MIATRMQCVYTDSVSAKMGSLEMARCAKVSVDPNSFALLNSEAKHSAQSEHYPIHNSQS